MRTTVNIQDDLLRRVKQLALERHDALGRVIDDALRKYFTRDIGLLRMESTRLETFKGKGLQPGVDMDSTASLLDVMEGR